MKLIYKAIIMSIYAGCLVYIPIHEAIANEFELIRNLRYLTFRNIK